MNILDGIVFGFKENMFLFLFSMFLLLIFLKLNFKLYKSFVFFNYSGHPEVKKVLEDYNVSFFATFLVFLFLIIGSIFLLDNKSLIFGFSVLVMLYNVTLMVAHSEFSKKESCFAIIIKEDVVATMKNKETLDNVFKSAKGKSKIKI